MRGSQLCQVQKAQLTNRWVNNRTRNCAVQGNLQFVAQNFTFLRNRLQSEANLSLLKRKLWKLQYAGQEHQVCLFWPKPVLAMPF